MIQDPLDVSLFDQVRLMLLILQLPIIATYNSIYGSSKLYHKLILTGLEILNREGKVLVVSKSQICMAKRLHSLPYLHSIYESFCGLPSLINT